MYGIHRRACYAQDEDGNYTIVPSQGWEVEKAVNQQAVNDIKEHVETVRQQVLAGEASPLAYHMARCQMDAKLLGANAGIWRWKVKRHLTPAGFAMLSDQQLEAYAIALNMPVAELKAVPQEEG